VTREQSSFAIAIGNGNGTFQARTSTGLNASVIASNSSGPIFVDINGDGKLDNFQPYNQTTQFSTFALGNGNGTFNVRVTLATQSYPSGGTTGDFNGDGFVDLVVGDSGYSNIFLGNGNGTFQARRTLPNYGYPLAMIALDLNGDGLLDLASADSSLVVNLGNGNGTFKPYQVFGSGPFGVGIASGDFNGDSVIDMLILDSNEDTASIYLANTASAAGVATVSITTQTLAENLITALDSAISSLSSYQANLAAIHSRLNHSIAGNLLMSENLEEARSNAIDTDYALEIAELVKNQILQSAQIAALTQANIQQELILRLLDSQN
jgi:flagellin-like hook-associated protein FlgL